MAGALTISTLNDDTGILATQNGMSGIAKAWVNYNGVGQSIRSSFNVSSVTYNGTGDYTVNFTTAFADANYTVIGSVGFTGGTVVFRAMPDGVAPTTTSCRVVTLQTNWTQLNSAYVMIQFNR
jgi:hypothetical protein